MSEFVADRPVEDLFDIVDAAARLIGGPVVVEDVDFRVLAYSTVAGQPNDEARRSAILNRRTPDRWLKWMEEAGICHRLQHDDRLVRLDAPWASSRTSRYIQPVRADGQVVGYLWFMGDGTELAPDFERTAHDFAEVLAPELSRRCRALDELPGGRLLRRFLGGNLTAAQLADALEVDGDDVDAVVLVFGADGQPAGPAAVRVLSRYTRTKRHTWLAGEVGPRTYLLHVAPELSEATVDQLVCETAADVERAMWSPIRTAAGSAGHGLASALRSRDEADLTLRVLEAGDRRAGCFSALRHEILVHEVVRFLRARPALTHGLLDALITHDRLHGTDYRRTLHVYLDCFGDVRRAAEALHIHANSLRYRLKRLADLASLDFADPDARLAVQLVLAATGST
ncbi:helix-turn-helix domain-containing protein [Streptomyces werraensis]|uniref:Helix-turn-helix domain-containing protein n=1 Tax=Streptomyces werraensis TaxID=68284 RepID=A0ABV3JPJ9_9ACTN